MTLHPSISVGVNDPLFQPLEHPANLSGAVTNGAGWNCVSPHSCTAGYRWTVPSPKLAMTCKSSTGVVKSVNEPENICPLERRIVWPRTAAGSSSNSRGTSNIARIESLAVETHFLGMCPLPFELTRHSCCISFIQSRPPHECKHWLMAPHQCVTRSRGVTGLTTPRHSAFCSCMRVLRMHCYDAAQATATHTPACRSSRGVNARDSFCFSTPSTVTEVVHPIFLRFTAVSGVLRILEPFLVQT